MKTLKFTSNINCAGCVRAVTPHLNEIKGIESWQVNTDHPDKILEVKSVTGDRQPVIDAVKKAGFNLAPLI